jgi:hypothetical protein
MDGTKRNVKGGNYAWNTYNLLDKKVPSGYTELGKGYCTANQVKENVNLDWCSKWCDDD